MVTGESENMAASEDEASGRFSRVAAAKFSTKWAGTIDEQQNSQAFWQDFFREVVGIKDLQEAGIEFEKKVVSSKKGTTTRIDVYWRDTLLVEQKSAGKDLEAAEVQAREYVVSLPPAQRPPVIVICDFARFRIVDILLNKSHEFLLEALPDNLQHIEAIAKRDAVSATEVQVEADQKAAKLMANLYLQLEKYGYSGHEASVFMVRVLFCLFADDTRMWSGRLFQKLVEDTNSEGTDLGPRIANLFALLDTPKNDRKGPQDPFMVDFPYVNGGIFAERIEVINFNGPMRAALIDCCNYDWSKINPTIFGALFQDIKSKDERRALGEHYTTEANIEKAIRPLFLDELNEKLEKAWDSESKLKELQRELGSYKILDPACGCGNFLITSYKRLRQLELDILVRLKQLQGTVGQTSLLDVKQDLFVNLEQLYGIEYVEWSSQIAKVAVYLADHQENLKLESVIGVASNRFPLTHSAAIVQGNALEVDWSDVCPVTERTIVVSNPPFLGSNWQSPEQRDDQKKVWANVKGSASLDFVANWYILAARYSANSNVRCAFVSTNSITQGEQPSILWGEMSKYGSKIDFAHRTFAWSSDASGKAAVHCVIIGFSCSPSPRTKLLWSYETPVSQAEKQVAGTINAYLADAPNLLISSRAKPLRSSTQPMRYGNMPNEFGYLANIYEEDLVELRKTNDPALNFIKPVIGAAEMLQDKTRYCLWLVDASPSTMNSSRFIRERIEMVRKLRSESKRAATVKLAATPYLFQEVREQQGDYLAVPIVSSENREYIPMKIYSKDVVPTNALLTIPGASLQTFAILQSKVFSIWLKTVAGRLESRFRISAEIVYNNFPFPDLDDASKEMLAKTAQAVVSARADFPDASLAELYNPPTMPQKLVLAHKANDNSVLSAFGLKPSSSDGEILTLLFSLYAELAGEGSQN
jgi:hypothetical protein